MNKRLLEIQARKAELLKELEGDVTEERLSEIEKEQATLETEEPFHSFKIRSYRKTFREDRGKAGRETY